MAAPTGSSTVQRPAAAPEAAPGQAAFRQLLCGSGRGEMNLTALAARGRDLQRSLDQMAKGLAHNAHNITWADALDRFAVLQVQWQQLVAQLRPLAKHYVANPKVVDPDTARVLPIMLATKLLPEMEAREAAALALHREAAGGASAEAQYDRLSTALERFNAGIERLTAAGKDGRPGGVLDPSGPWRKDIQAAGRPAGAVGGGAATLRRPAGKVAPQKRKSPEQEELLAAVATGEGLRK